MINPFFESYILDISCTVKLFVVSSTISTALIVSLKVVPQYSEDDTTFEFILVDTTLIRLLPTPIREIFPEPTVKTTLDPDLTLDQDPVIFNTSFESKP